MTNYLSKDRAWSELPINLSSARHQLWKKSLANLGEDKPDLVEIHPTLMSDDASIDQKSDFFIRDAVTIVVQKQNDKKRRAVDVCMDRQRLKNARLGR